MLEQLPETVSADALEQMRGINDRFAITASFGEAFCVKAFSGCGLNPGSRLPQRAPGRAWRSVRFWYRLAACCEAR